VEWVGDVPEHWTTAPLRRLILEQLVNGIFKKRDEFGEGTLLVNVFDIYQGDFKIKFRQLDRVKCDDWEIDAYRVLPGDLFFVRSSLKQEGIAAVALAEPWHENAVFECHLIRARPNPTLLHARFGSYLLNSVIYRSKTLSIAKITTMTTLDQEAVLSIVLPVPPVREQRAIAEYLDRKAAGFEELIDSATSAVGLLWERRSALISAAVTGKIDVRNYVPKEAE
jgi:type I restriction enzyme S subunit